MDERPDPGKDPDPGRNDAAARRQTGWRDKPVDEERDKDLKEGGIAGARKEQRETGKE